MHNIDNKQQRDSETAASSSFSGSFKKAVYISRWDFRVD